MAQNDSGSGMNGLLVGFLVGAAVGAALGVLYAPKSGKETRAVIGEKYKDIRNRAGEAASNARERVGEFATAAREKFRRGEPEDDLQGA